MTTARNRRAAQLRADDAVLVIIDTQERLMQAMAETERDAATANQARLLQGAALLDVPVVETRQYPEGLGETVEPVAANLPAHTTRIDKTGFSCCQADPFTGHLYAMRRHQVVLTGVEAHICVTQTALDLLHGGFDVFVAADATCSRLSANRELAMARLRHADAVILPTESVLFEWVRDASHPQFKAISKLVR